MVSATVGLGRTWHARLAAIALLVAPSLVAVACYSTDGLVGPPATDDASTTDGYVPPPDADPPPGDAIADASDAGDADDATPPQPFDAACGTPAFEDHFDDETTGLNLWSPDFTSGTGAHVLPGRGDAGGAAELSVPAGAAGYAQLGYTQALTDRTVVRFFFQLVESDATVNLFEAINGPNLRVVVEAPTSDGGLERTITAYVPGNVPQRWVNIKVGDYHEIQIVLDKRKADGGTFLVAQMTLDDMFVRTFPTRFASPETPSFFLTARRVAADAGASTVRFDDARFWACTDGDADAN